MDKFLELVNGLPQDQKIIFYKYMAIISVCKMDVDAKIAFIQEKKITLDTARSLARLFSMDIKNIKTRYKLYQEAGLEKVVLSYPEILRYSPSKVISRIKACEQVGKAYLIDGVPAPYLFDDQQWEVVKNAIADDQDEQHTINPFIKTETANEDYSPNVDDFIPEESVDADVLAFEKYERLSKMLENVRQAIGAPANNASNELSSDEFLMREVGTNPDKSDKDIIKECLQACDGITEGVDEIIDELLYAEKDRVEKRGL